MELKYAIGAVVDETLTFLSELNVAKGIIGMSEDTKDMMLGSEEECLKLANQLSELTGRNFEVIEVNIKED